MNATRWFIACSTSAKSLKSSRSLKRIPCMPQSFLGLTSGRSCLQHIAHVPYIYMLSTSINMTELFMKFVNIDNNIAVRGMVADNGTEYYLSVFDFINYACGKKASSTYGRNLFYRLIAIGSDHASELLSFCRQHQFTGDVFCVR